MSTAFDIVSIELRLHVSHRLKVPIPGDIKSNSEDHAQWTTLKDPPIPTLRLTKTSSKLEPKTNLTMESKIRPPEPTR